jgi:hypothetical protein
MEPALSVLQWLAQGRGMAISRKEHAMTLKDLSYKHNLLLQLRRLMEQQGIDELEASS